MALILNCDLGESEAMAADGRQQQMLQWIDLANVCCGAHAGSPWLTRLTMQQAAEAGVAVGAHPGYPDKEHFGRRKLYGVEFDALEVADFVAEQVAVAREAAREAGLELYHVKPHGALYNEAAENAEVAEAIARGVLRISRDMVLVGLANSIMLEVFRASGFGVLREAFADRRYTTAGLLVPRSEPGAVLEDADEAIAQLQRLSTFSDTVCVHGDSPGAMAMLPRVRKFAGPRRKASGAEGPILGDGQP